MAASGGKRGRSGAGGSAGAYWDAEADAYQAANRIGVDDFHYGPLLPGDRELRLLPRRVRGLRCLEAGCGGAQNSVHLARRGALCTACDVSARQLRHAADLARAHGAEVALLRCSLDRVATRAGGPFDLVFTSYSLGYVADPARALAGLARLLAPGGTLLVTEHHPAFSGSWRPSEGGAGGVWLRNYFRPAPMARTTAGCRAVYRFVPPPAAIAAATGAGLRVVRYLEPEPLPVHRMGRAAAGRRVPYDGPAWRALYPLLRRVPIAYVLQAAR